MSTIELATSPVLEIATSERSAEGEVPQTFSSRCALTRRGLQIVLGALWLLDGVLQLQPFMFTPGFAHQVIAPSAAGQPVWVAWPVLHAAALIGAHAVVVDVLFAVAQLMLGAGFLLRRTVRPVVVASVVWALGVWFLGEAIGGLAGGTASLLTGAPGAALLYGVLALAAWPLSSPPAAGSGEVPGWFIRAWAALWFGYGLLALRPANRSTASVVGQLRTPIGHVPGWLGSIDTVASRMANDLGGAPAVLLILLPIGVGLLTLGSDRSRHVGAWTGIVIALTVWAVGQSFGFIASGTATDPNAGPLLVVGSLVLLGMTPTSRRSGGRPTQVGRAFSYQS